MDDKQNAISLLNKTIQKRDILISMNTPNTNYCKSQLRGNMLGRLQRQENRRFVNEMNRQKNRYDQQINVLNNYIESLDSGSSRVSGFGLEVQKKQPLLPETSFFGLPKLTRVGRRSIR